MKEHEKAILRGAYLKGQENALLRVAFATYQLCVSNRLYHKHQHRQLEDSARNVIMQVTGVDVSKIDYEGKADTILYARLLEIYNRHTGENHTALLA